MRNVLVFLCGAVIVSVSLLLSVVDSIAATTDSIAQPAQVTVYTARQILTMDSAQPEATAVAVSSDGIILAVGSKDDVLETIGAKKNHVNTLFNDKVILPGFIEPHIHPVLTATTLTSEVIAIENWDLLEELIPAAKNGVDYMERLRKAERAIKDEMTPLLSWGFHHYFHGSLTRQQLDAVSKKRPIVIWHRSGHEFILNSAALRSINLNQAQIDELPSDVSSQIDLSKGQFWERGAFEFLLPKIMSIVAPRERLLAGLDFTKRYLHSGGVTTSAEPGGLDDLYELQMQVLGDRATPFRFYFIPDGRMLALHHHGKDLISATEEMLREANGHSAFLTKQVKLFADGAIYSQLMQMKDGYLDGHKGEWMMEPSRFSEAFRTYWDAGYQIHVHQNGDAGLEMVLDVLEENMKRNPRSDHRTTIVHFGFATTKQVKKIASLGAIVSANPYYTTALAKRYSEIGIGSERAQEMVRLGDVVREGISLSLHSDMPMAPAKPLYLVWAAVNRTMEDSDKIAAPGQQIDALSALRAITLDAAYLLRLEDEVGSISPGKKANFTVLDESPLDVDPRKIKDIGIWGTVLEGRLQPLPVR